MNALEDLGFDRDRYSDDINHLSPDETIGRVLRVERGRHLVATSADLRWSVWTGKQRYRAEAQAHPAVGDWVVVRDGRTEKVLARTTTLSRKAAGTRSDEQLIATNVDRVFVVTAVGGDLSARRVERYISVIRRGGATPVVVLNKTDLPFDIIDVMRTIDDAAPGVPLCMISSAAGDLSVLEPYLKPRTTIALLGSSGVGKSTLVNRLLGEDRQRTSAVRAKDETGRHTTTRRELLVLPNGALLIDTPGMREVGLVGEPDTVDDAFDEIARLAEQCRFADCSHGVDPGPTPGAIGGPTPGAIGGPTPGAIGGPTPGCAVQAALASGQLSEERWASYQQLRREAAYEARRADERRQDTKARWKAIHKGLRARRKIDPKMQR